MAKKNTLFYETIHNGWFGESLNLFKCLLRISELYWCNLKACNWMNLSEKNIWKNSLPMLWNMIQPTYKFNDLTERTHELIQARELNNNNKKSLPKWLQIFFGNASWPYGPETNPEMIIYFLEFISVQKINFSLLQSKFGKIYFSD